MLFEEKKNSPKSHPCVIESILRLMGGKFRRVGKGRLWMIVVDLDE